MSLIYYFNKDSITIGFKFFFGKKKQDAFKWRKSLQQNFKCHISFADHDKIMAINISLLSKI